MNDTGQESKGKTPRRPSKGSVGQVADAGSGDSISRLPHGAGGQYDLILCEANSETLAMGDILVDVDAGPGGTGLVVWIVGG